MPCPDCKGEVVQINPTNGALVEGCDVCEGHGFVPLEVCKGCGRPAWLDYPVMHCGRDECFKQLARVIDNVAPKFVDIIEAAKPRRIVNGMTRFDVFHMMQESKADDDGMGMTVMPWGES